MGPFPCCRKPKPQPDTYYYIMNQPNSTWRADGGYLALPNGANPYYFPPTQPLQPTFVSPAPVPIHGVLTQSALRGYPPPPPYTHPSAPKEENPSSSYAPPALSKGENYMFPASHTKLHIFNKAAPVWESKYRSQQLAFKVWKVPTTTRLSDVIVRVLQCGQDDGKAKGWGITEVEELGSGRWSKGPTVVFDDAKAAKTLAERGWTSKRGDKLPPVWVVIHKV